MGPHRSKRGRYINKKILSAFSERVKRQLKAEYVKKGSGSEEEHKGGQKKMDRQYYR